tara:strand:- start:66 stop:245 length:180 start_codon:yes stop_codon:yes gene_type:complete
MYITNAKYVETDNGGSIYVSIKATIDGTSYSVPTSVGNTYYDEILRQVAAGTLTIADAD